MKSETTKFTVAAVVIIVAVLSVSIFNKSASTAFGIERAIADYNNIRFLHIKQFVEPNQQEPEEFWIKSDELGRVSKARYYLPVTGDGVKLVTWIPGRAEIWDKSANRFIICQTKQQTKQIEGGMQSLIEQCQPKLVMKKLLEDQKADVVDINTVKPQKKQEPATIITTYKSKAKKKIYYINQETDLITHIEFYRIEDNREVLESTTRFSDYNIPIDEKMFSLKDEVPKDVTVINQLE